MEVETVSAWCRFVRDTDALLLWGGSVYIAVLVPRHLRESLALRFRPVRGVAILTLVAVIAVLLPVQAAALGDGWSDALRLETLQDLLRETSTGTAWIAQATLATLMLIALALPTPWRDPMTAVLSGLFLVALTLTGHAAMHEGWLGLVHRANQSLHLLAAGFWLGALVPLLATLAALKDPERYGPAVIALRRFSTIGHGAVITVFTTGASNVALILGQWPLQWASTYQSLLALKIFLASLMTALAIINRYWFVPRLPRAPHAMRDRIRLATIAEIALGLGATALVAAFGQFEPS